MRLTIMIALASATSTLAFTLLPSLTRTRTTMLLEATGDGLFDEDMMDASKGVRSDQRRDLIRAVGASTLAFAFGPEPSQAAETASTSAPVNEKDILQRMRNIPTFLIVDANGIPFMIFNGSNGASGYCFLSLQVAARVLNDARTKDKGSESTWAEARIITLPLAVSMQLGLRNIQRRAINADNIKINTFNEIVASEEGVIDAQLVDTKKPDRWAQRGRVPLFFLKGMTLPSEGNTGAPRQPRYFNKADCLAEWERQYPGQTPPDMQVIEMVEMYRNAFKSSNLLGSVENIVLVPVAETNEVAAEIIRNTPPSLQYSFKDVILVTSTK